MDVWGIYVGDSTMSYGGSVRSTYYRDYEQFPYGTLEQNSNVQTKDPYSKVQEKFKLKSDEGKKKQCPFCKEHKKRPLIKYMRKRDSRKHHESICEDVEEENIEKDKIFRDEEKFENLSNEYITSEHQH